MDERVVPGEVAADAQVNGAVAAIEEKLTRSRREPGGKGGHGEEADDAD